MSKIEDLQDRLFKDFHDDAIALFKKYEQACEALGCQLLITGGGVSVVDHTSSRDRGKVICASSSLDLTLVREITKWHD